MDYMSLGSKSRKTGFKLNKKVDKDEYSMENMDDYFDDEENRDNTVSNILNTKSEELFTLAPKVKEFHPNRSGLSIKSLSQTNVKSRSQNCTSTPVLNTPTRRINPTSLPFKEAPIHSTLFPPVDNVMPTQITYESDVSNFQTNYGIPKTIIEEDEDGDEDELTSNNKKIRQSLPDLMEESEVEYSTSEESSLLNTSQDALLESEIDAKYPQTNNVNGTENTDYTFPEDITRQDIQGKNSITQLRRSNRIKIPTLDYWRNEKIVYKRRSEAPSLDIAKVITYEQEDDVELKSKINTKRRNNVIEKKPRKKVKFDDSATDDYAIDNLRNINSDIFQKIAKGQPREVSWMDTGMLEGTVVGRTPLTKRSKTKREILAIAPNYINNEREYHSKEDEYKISVLFNSQKNHFTNGYLTLPINGQKSRSTIDDLYIIFHVLTGIVEVSISNNNKFICVEGSTFQVPSHTSYSLANRGKDEVKLYFVQIIIN